MSTSMKRLNEQDKAMILSQKELSKDTVYAYGQRSRRATRDELNRAHLARDPWHQWHILNVIGLVLEDASEDKTVPDIVKKLLVLTPYCGTYDEAKQFSAQANLRRYISENGITYDRLADHYGSRVAEEIITWARQLTQSTSIVKW